MIKNIIRPLLIISVVLLSLTACGGKDYTYVDPNEDHTSPGLLSGEDSVFHVIDYQKKDNEKVSETLVVEPAS